MAGIASRRLRHRVRIERPEESQNPETGASEIVWALYGYRWAEYVASSLREFIAASAYQSEVKGRFVFRADPGIEAGMRVLHGNPAHLYAVLGVLPDPDSGLEYVTAPVTAGVIFDGR